MQGRQTPPLQLFHTEPVDVEHEGAVGERGQLHVEPRGAGLLGAHGDRRGRAGPPLLFVEAAELEVLVRRHHQVHHVGRRLGHAGGAQLGATVEVAQRVDQPLGDLAHEDVAERRYVDAEASAWGAHEGGSLSIDLFRPVHARASIGRTAPP